VVWDRFDKNNPDHKKPVRADDEEDKDIDDDDLGEEWERETATKDHLCLKRF
jgi:hypothetical protein